MAIIILPIKSKMATAKKQCFLRFVLFFFSPTLIQSPDFLQMTINVALVIV